MVTDGPIFWSSRNQSAIALSSTQVEYEGATQCVWLQGILGEFGIEYDTSIFIYCEKKALL